MKSILNKSLTVLVLSTALSGLLMAAPASAASSSTSGKGGFSTIKSGRQAGSALLYDRDDRYHRGRHHRRRHHRGHHNEGHHNDGNHHRGHHNDGDD